MEAYDCKTFEYGCPESPYRGSTIFKCKKVKSLVIAYLLLILSLPLLQYKSNINILCVFITLSFRLWASLTYVRRNMAEIFPIRRKTLCNQSINWLKSKIVSWTRDQVSFPCLTCDDLLVRGYVVPMHVLRKTESIGTPSNWSRATRHGRMVAEHVYWDANKDLSHRQKQHMAPPSMPIMHCGL